MLAPRALNTTKNPINFCSTYLSPVPNCQQGYHDNTEPSSERLQVSVPEEYEAHYRQEILVTRIGAVGAQVIGA